MGSDGPMARNFSRSLIGGRRASINFDAVCQEKKWGGHAGPPLRLVATALCLAAQCEAPRTNINNGVVVIAKPPIAARTCTSVQPASRASRGTEIGPWRSAPSTVARR